MLICVEHETSFITSEPGKIKGKRRTVRDAGNIVSLLCPF